MSDPATRLFNLAMKWKKTSGGVFLTVLSACTTFALTQWNRQNTRISTLETAQTQQYTQSKLQEQALNNIASDFKDFHGEYRQDVGDIRRALMIPQPRGRTTAAAYSKDTSSTP